MKKILITLLFALVGLQNVFAQSPCGGYLYFKAPSDWRKVYVVSIVESVQLTEMKIGIILI